MFRVNNTKGSSFKLSKYCVHKTVKEKFCVKPNRYVIFLYNSTDNMVELYFPLHNILLHHRNK